MGLLSGFTPALSRSYITATFVLLKLEKYTNKF